MRERFDVHIGTPVNLFQLRTDGFSVDDEGYAVTYDGHALYTYVGDSAPGQATGNDINLNGGYWYEMNASG